MADEARTADVDPRPIGAFDSGVGGLTVVRELRRTMPNERIVYVGDTANVPYGGRPSEQVRDFSFVIARYLLDEHDVKAIMVPCNTATSSAVAALREAFPAIPIIGTEPGVKPAAAATRSGTVGVLATVGTLQGERFARLVSTFAEGVTVLTQPCPGWVDLVEAGLVDGSDARRAVCDCVKPLLERGADVLVLGCTHFPVLAPLIREVAGPHVTLIDTANAIVRRVAKVVVPAPEDASGGLAVYCTGDAEQFQRSARHVIPDIPAVVHISPQ